MGRLLRVCGYEVATYESAEQLLERLPDDARPSCILLDVKIPGLSGPELQDRLAIERAAQAVSLMHLVMKLILAAPLSALPSDPTAFGKQASRLHLAMALLFATPA